MTDERRRSSDHDIGYIRGRVEAILEGMKDQNEKLDEIAGLKPIVARHDLWIEGDGKAGLKKIAEIETKISNARIGLTAGFKGWLLAMGLVGTGGVAVAFGKSLMATLSTLIQH